MQLATPHNIGKALVEALGLTGQSITKVVITAEVGEVVTVEVTQLVGFDECKRAITELSAYTLTPKLPKGANPFPPPDPEFKR